MKKAILHEGNAKKTNDNELLRLLIKDMGLNIDQVEFFGFGAKSNFFKAEFNRYKVLKQRIQEEEIDKILFVVDADYKQNDKKYGGYKNTEIALKQVIDDLKLTDCTDFYITCDPKTKDGYLESFILSTIPDTRRACIEQFLQCSNFKSKKNHKSILNQVYKMAYPEPPFYFSHKNFIPLKQKIKDLIEA